MPTAKSLLAELSSITEDIADKHLTEFRRLNQENPNNLLEHLQKVMLKDCTSNIARAATDIVHKSIIEGVDDREELIVGIQQNNMLISQKNREAVIAELQKYPRQK